jgi:hypothetical protein
MIGVAGDHQHKRLDPFGALVAGVKLKADLLLVVNANAIFELDAL